MGTAETLVVKHYKDLGAQDVGTCCGTCLVFKRIVSSNRSTMFGNCRKDPHAHRVVHVFTVCEDFIVTDDKVALKGLKKSIIH